MIKRIIAIAILCFPKLIMAQCLELPTHIGFSSLGLSKELYNSTLEIKVAGHSNRKRILNEDGSYREFIRDIPGQQGTNDKWWIQNGIFYLSDGPALYKLDLSKSRNKGIYTYQGGEEKVFTMFGFPQKELEVIQSKPSADYSVSLCIKNIVEQKMNVWQQKGEFEKSNDFLARMNEKNRRVQLELFQNQAYDSIAHIFASKYFYKSKIELGKYDADNETFLLKNDFGEYVLNVPIDEAKQFKSEFESYLFREEKFVVSNDKFLLSHIEVYRNDFAAFEVEEAVFVDDGDFKRELPVGLYIYDLKNSQNYSITDIEYDFAEIELPEINSSTKTPIQIGSNNIRVGSSEVDLNIPANTKVDNRYAIVIGNEDYQSYQRSLNAEQNVDYAVNDAKVFKEYCLKTFGVKEENLDFITNATAGAMNQKFNKVIKLMEKIGPQAELIVYYAGHGFPDEITKEPYLVPVDVSGTDLSAAIKLEDLYRDLGNTGAKVTVFLDACFTGGGRNSGLIAARGVRVKPQDEILNGNLVVLSASSGDQSALPYHQEGHGMFTYFLLEKLQNDRGYMTLGQLADYINRNVSITSLKVNEKEQDPVVNTSEKVSGSWRNWTF